jgi:hypothetical protein
VLLMVSRRLRIHGWRAERRVPLQFWPDDPTTLDPHRYVERDWDPREREQVLAYLDACYEAPFMSPSPFIWCPFGCKHPNPRGQVMVTDGTWWFMDILIHYLQDHAVKLPAEFLTHIQRLGYRVPVLPAE